MPLYDQLSHPDNVKCNLRVKREMTIAGSLKSIQIGIDIVNVILSIPRCPTKTKPEGVSGRRSGVR